MAASSKSDMNLDEFVSKTSHSIEPLHWVDASCQAVVWLDADSVAPPDYCLVRVLGGRSTLFAALRLSLVWS